MYVYSIQNMITITKLIIYVYKKKILREYVIMK